MSLHLASLIPEEISTIGGESESPVDENDPRFNTDNVDSVPGARLVIEGGPLGSLEYGCSQSATTPGLRLGIHSAPPKLLQEAGKLHHHQHHQQSSEPSPSSHRGYNIQFDTSVSEYPSPPPASCSPPLRREDGQVG